MQSKASFIRAEEDVAFCSPWQASLFVLLNRLVATDHIAIREWGDAFGTELKACEVPDDPDRYFECWMHALEKLLVDSAFLEMEEIDRQTEELMRRHDHR